MVVEEDGAAAQHQRCVAVAGNEGCKRRDRLVEEGGAAGRDDQRCVAADAGTQPQEHIGGHCQQAGYHLIGATGLGLRRRPFIGRNAGDQQPPAASRDRIGDGLGLRGGAGARPARTKFDQHAQRRQRRIGAPSLGKRVHGVDRVGKDIELGIRPGTSKHGQPVGAAGSSNLIGDDQPCQAGLQHHCRLPDVGDRRAPCAGLDQRPGKIGRHRRLGMRSDLNIVFARIAQEQVAIGGEGRLVEGQHRKRHASIRGMPALGRDKAAVKPGCAGRHAADAVVEPKIFVHRKGWNR
ncbi:hypothetical protein X728_00425 [Mesorhizobium sp. L103C120A0]|nr:hypothetical protein X728_00425 [Mesorhizobium sp. L103C120A0]